MRKYIGLIVLSILVLTGCATSSRYVSYTNQIFHPKDPSFSVDVYPATLKPNFSQPYYVIGNVSVEGFVSDGVSADTLTNKARTMAQKKGADAIVNAKTVAYTYLYGDTLLRFTGDLIVYVPKATNGK